MSLDPTGDFFRRYLAEGALRLAELDKEIAERESETGPDAAHENFLRYLAHRGVDVKDVNMMQRAELGCPLKPWALRRVDYLKQRGVEGDVLTEAFERIGRRSIERKVRVTPPDRVSTHVKGPHRQEARDGDACKRSA